MKKVKINEMLSCAGNILLEQKKIWNHNYKKIPNTLKKIIYYENVIDMCKKAIDEDNWQTFFYIITNENIINDIDECFKKRKGFECEDIDKKKKMLKYFILKSCADLIK